MPIIAVERSQRKLASRVLESVHTLSPTYNAVNEATSSSTTSDIPGNKSSYHAVVGIHVAPNQPPPGPLERLQPHPRIRMITSLPTDILFSIIRVLPIPDLLALGATCKALHTAIEDRSVWVYAMGRILATIPMPHVSTSMPSMSTRELRHRVLQSALLESVWSNTDFLPESFRSVPCKSSVRGVRLLPDGREVVMLIQDGSLELYKADVDVPVAVTLSPTKPVGSVHWIASLSSTYEPLVLLKIDSPNKNASDLYLYHVDLETPALTLRASVTSLRPITHFSAGGDLLAFVTRNEERCVLHVQSVPHESGAHTEQVLIKGFEQWLGTESECAVSLLSRGRMAVTNNQGTSTFYLPELKPILPNSLNIVLSLSPTWTGTGGNASTLLPQVSPVIWEPSGSHTRTMAVLKDNSLHVLNLGQSESQSWIVPFDTAVGLEGYDGLFRGPKFRPADVGFHRVLFHTGRGMNADGKRVITFRTCIIPSAVSLSASQTPAAQRLGSFAIPSEDGREFVQEVSFDEGTGRLCILVMIYERFVRAKRIVYVDVV
ncbi:hypothetical protein NEOLEDRAFT_1129054 [Neolentinus lepideus HHB14362 ss-1]|uniref:F-box domain-containing protein n=1 Tax=Neolentinus lepideus HHB14362 ss-1 TaxID=1314782 RepID=A0A165UWZ5_9AGAM|nr:hypothetical protein NEOLEDRAFT_1129054 [Neolentinus lepideus HHB14362 ss-1]